MGALPVVKLARDFWLQNIIGARRSAAQMRFGRFADIVAGADEETRGRVHHLLSVLQRTGGMIGDGEPAPVTGRKIDVVQEFADVLRHCRKPRDRKSTRLTSSH